MSSGTIHLLLQMYGATRQQRNRLQVTTRWVRSWTAMGVLLMSRAPDPVLVKILLSNVAVIDTGVYQFEGHCLLRNQLSAPERQAQESNRQ